MAYAWVEPTPKDIDDQAHWNFTVRESTTMSDSQDVPAGLVYTYRARLEADQYGGTESPREDGDTNAAHIVIGIVRGYDTPNEDDTDGRILRSLADDDTNYGDRDWRKAALYLAAFCDAVVVPVWASDDRNGLSVSSGRRVNGGHLDDLKGTGNGVAYIRRSWARKNLVLKEGEVLDDVIEQVIRAEVSYYASWCEGEVYGGIAERRELDSDDEWEIVESVWGYIGDEGRADALGEAVAACEAQRKEDDDAEIARLAEVANAESEIAEMRAAEMGA